MIGFAGNGSFPVTFSVLPDVKRFLGPSVEQLLLKDCVYHARRLRRVRIPLPMTVACRPYPPCLA